MQGFFSQVCLRQHTQKKASLIFFNQNHLISWYKALNKAIVKKKNHTVWKRNSFMYWTRKVVKYSLKLFNLFKAVFHADLQMKTVLFKLPKLGRQNTNG